jgi:hypothetical protein
MPDETTSPRELFAASVETAARALPSVTSVERTPEGFGILVRLGGKEHTLFLDNLFEETRDLDPEERERRVARLLRAAFQRPPDPGAMSWADVRPKLAPLLRPATQFGGLPGLAADARPLSRPFAPFLLECVGIDSEDGIAYATPGLVSTWGVGAPEVFAAALENGRAYFTEDVESYDAQAPYPIFYVARDDSYESSRILVPGWLASFADKVVGKPVAIVPHRGLVIVGGDGDNGCLRRLIDAGKAEFEASPRRISPALYTVDGDGKVVPLTLPAGHPLATDVLVGHHMTAISEYQIQEKQLEERLEEDIFISSYSAVRDLAGNAFSYTTWTKNVPTLLPKADEVALILDPADREAEILRVPWDKLLEIADDCVVREPEMDPPRWRATGWPRDEAVTRLRAIAMR